jgi:hypothetical protein
LTMGRLTQSLYAKPGAEGEKNMSEVREYLDAKGISYKEAFGANGNEAILAKCPFCFDNKYHFYVNLETGVYHCKKCAEGGGFFNLKKQLGDIAPVQSFADMSMHRDDPSMDIIEEVEEAHQAMLQSKEGLLYCEERGFTIGAIKKMKLGFSREGGYSYIWYPYLCGGRALNVKKRRLDSKEFKRIPNMPSILYNADASSKRTDYIVVCEGEADVVAMVSHGFEHVVGTTIGAKGIANEWVAQLDKFPKIIFAYDNDDDGREGSYKFADRMGLERCYYIQIPPTVKDINEFFLQGGNSHEMDRLINQAKKFDVEHVSQIGDIIKREIMRREKVDVTEDRLHFPWAKLDYLTDGLVGGDLVILSAKPGIGKTTMALNILYRLAVKDTPVLLFEMEMRPERIMPRVVALHLRMDSKNVMSSDVLPQAYKELSPIPFYFAYIYKKPTFDKVADTIRACVRNYGIKLVVFDNLHFLCRSVSDQTREVSVVIQSLKLLAEELAIPIITIARPRKNTGKIISNVDLKDSADIEGDADIIILLHREPKPGLTGDYVDSEGIYEDRMLTRISKCRYSPGGEIYLRMDDKTASVHEWSSK